MTEILFCLLGLALMVLGVLALVRPSWFWKLARRGDAGRAEPPERYYRGSRLTGALLLLIGTVLFLVMLAAAMVYLVF